MPIVGTVNGERGWLTVTASGVVTYAEILAHLDDEKRSQNLPLPELIDALGATLDITPDEVRGVVSRMRTFGNDDKLGPTAVVVSDDFAYGMLRMLEIMVEDVAAVRPFRKLEEARHWLASA